MEAQIRSTMRSAMRKLLSDTLAKETLTDRDIGWIRSLCSELVARINSLTPNRPDLHAQLESQFDTDLIVQMLSNGAFERSDAMQATDAILGRIAMLCSPSQDKKVETLRSDAERGLHDIGELIFEAHALVDEIEDLAAAAKATLGI